MKPNSAVKLRQQNKQLKAHLTAAYQEIGKLKVRLIAASLGNTRKKNEDWDQLTTANYQSKESSSDCSVALI